MNDQEKQALSKCMAICSKAEKCISDIQKKLNEWEIDPSESQKIISQLVTEKFIDEERYANYYVRDKFRFNQWGKVKIAFQLKMKKISAQTIQQALDEIDAEAYNNLLRKLLQDKIRKTKFKNNFDRKAKLYNFATSKGFEFDIISKILNEIE